MTTYSNFGDLHGFPVSSRAGGGFDPKVPAEELSLGVFALVPISFLSLGLWSGALLVRV